MTCDSQNLGLLFTVEVRSSSSKLIGALSMPQNQELNKLLYNIICLRYLIIVMKNKRHYLIQEPRELPENLKKVAFKAMQEETELYQNAHYGDPESR